MKHIKENNYLSTYLQIKFSNLIFYYDAIAIDDVKFGRFVGDLVKNNQTFRNTIYTYNNYTDSLIAISYSNKDFGLFSINDKLNDTEYFILK